MHENGKVLFTPQSGFFDLAKPAQSLRGVERMAITLNPETSPQKMARRAAMEYFGRAIAELLDCKSCYVATMFPNATSGLEDVRIGHATADSSCAAMVERIARKGASADCTLIEPVNVRTNLVARLIGARPGGEGHSVVGRLSAGNSATVVFVAGWRTVALASAEIPCVARAIRLMWDTATAVARVPRQRPDLQTWLQDLIFPAIVVDEELVIHEANGHGRALLEKGELLKADRGTLAGVNSSVTENLKKALSERLMAQGHRTWLDTTVPLSIDHQQFAFARIGAVPGEAGKLLVIVPQFDEVSGARRIASAFGLTWAEERIIARILHGQCPRRIGADLRLTEATVRTYTKRIMLKLGINRQSEFFLLYHLTLSPFGEGARNRSYIQPAPSPGLNGSTH
ncbi:helix-turn-helix transcriptional regulator [Afipia sp. TerB]